MPNLCFSRNIVSLCHDIAMSKSVVSSIMAFVAIIVFEHFQLMPLLCLSRRIGLCGDKAAPSDVFVFCCSFVATILPSLLLEFFSRQKFLMSQHSFIPYSVNG